MTVANTKPVNRFVSTGLSRYDFDFAVRKKEDVEVIITDPDTFREITLIYGAEYSVTQTEGGGFITLNEFGLEKISDGHYVTLVRHPEFNQEIDFAENSAFHMNTVEAGFDHLCHQVQYLKELIDRSVKGPLATTDDFNYFALQDLERKVDQLTVQAAPDAEESQKGIAMLASAEDALAGMDNSKIMTPLGTAAYVKQSLSGIVYIGAFHDFFEETPPAGWLVRNGATLVNADKEYKELWRALHMPENAWRLRTLDEWNSLSTTAGGIGGVPYFVLDSTAKTVKLPDTRTDFFRNADSGNVGTWQGDTIREIKGTFTAGGTSVSWREATGAFKEIGNKYTNIFMASTSGYQQSFWSNDKIEFSANVPTSNECRPRNIALLGCVYVGK